MVKAGRRGTACSVWSLLLVLFGATLGWLGSDWLRAGAPPTEPQIIQAFLSELDNPGGQYDFQPYELGMFGRWWYRRGLDETRVAIGDWEFRIAVLGVDTPVPSGWRGLGPRDGTNWVLDALSRDGVARVEVLMRAMSWRAKLRQKIISDDLGGA